MSFKNLEELRAEIDRRYAAAGEAWLMAGGCSRCRGSRFVSQNFSDTMDYSDWRPVTCPACANDHAKRPGPLGDFPASVEAAAFARLYEVRHGRWARSLTTRGRAAGKEGAILGKEGAILDMPSGMALATESGELVFVAAKRIIVVPEERERALRVLLRRAANSSYRHAFWEALTRTDCDPATVIRVAMEEATAVEHLDRIIGTFDPLMTKDQKDELAVRRDQLAERDPRTQADPDACARWVNRNGRWLLRGDRVAPGECMVRTRDGRMKLVRVVAMEGEFGVPA